jgi:hypothetical protein
MTHDPTIATHATLYLHVTADDMASSIIHTVKGIPG